MNLTVDYRKKKRNHFTNLVSNFFNTRKTFKFSQHLGPSDDNL